MMETEANRKLGRWTTLICQHLEISECSNKVNANTFAPATTHHRIELTNGVTPSTAMAETA
jgi:hypothetical protein